MTTIKMTKRGWLKSAIAAGALLIAMPLAAQEFPSRSITLVVPFAPGGNTDLTARIYADALSREIGQPVVVDNRPGAGGTTGGGIVASAAPDGYTLLWSGSSLVALAPLLYPDLSYDIATAFQPVGRIMTHSIVLAAHPSLPADTIEEFVAYARENPEAINYGSPGVGTIHHLTMELFKAEADFDAQHIPYQGNGPASADLLGGTIQAMFIGVPQAMPFKGGDELKFLGVTSAQEDVNLPGVPSFSDHGYAALEVSQSWYGVLGPAGVPDAVLEKLASAWSAAAQDPRVIAAAADQGMSLVVESPADFDTEIKTTSKTWADLVETTGMTFN